uniref:Uncharacterized protein n=1 Tax=viral metagenome TaxID=1070528 RepID=A0A6C0D9N0_9ZZZZ
MYIILYMNYYLKYLKYKQKYVNLQKQTGGGKETAKKLFLTHYESSKDILQKDFERGILKNISEPEGIFEEIFNIVGNDTKNIDWIIKSYIVNKTFGNPSSLENYGRFKTSIEEYNKLSNNKKMVEEYNKSSNKMVTDFRLINNINGLIELEKFIESNTDILHQIDEKNKRKHKKREEQKGIREEGENDAEIILDTENVIVYRPTTEAGSKFYGRNTRWCTAARDECMFNYYYNQGDLYIIQSKLDPKTKFQLHIKTDSLMDSKDEPVKIQDIYDIFHNEKLEEWFKEIIYKYLTWVYYNVSNSKNEIIIDRKIACQIDLSDLFESLYLFETTLYIDIVCNEVLNYLPKSIKNLIFNGKFNQSIEALAGLTNLQSLTFSTHFNQSIEALAGLTNLKSLIFSSYFNKPIGPLAGLTNLEILTFGSEFNQNIGTLAGLTNLEILTFGTQFNLSIEQLAGLTNLKSLTFGFMFEQDIKPLAGLTQLKSLKFGSEFNQDIKPLAGLTNLQSLTLGNIFNKSIESLAGLSNLHILIFGNVFNQKIKPLVGLTNLQSLTFGNDFNQNIKPLVGLTNLQSLTFGNDFNQNIKPLVGLTNLQSLTFGNGFNQDIRPLAGLTNLQTLIFGERFNQDLTPLSRLNNLQNLTIPYYLNQDPLIELLNLKIKYINRDSFW